MCIRSSLTQQKAQLQAKLQEDRQRYKEEHPLVQQEVPNVQFVLADRGAKSVTVAGDFNSWDTAATPLTDADGDGVWSGLVALRPGSHKYMFVVDGQKWVTDPEADHYIDDGFGMRNAVVTVASPNGRSI